MHLVSNLMRNTFPQVGADNDLAEYVGRSVHPGLDAYYCDNCESIDRIGHQITEWSYLIKASQSDAVIVVGDIENLPCASERKGKIEAVFDDKVEKDNIRYVFSRPTIEEIYWDFPDVIAQILKKKYRAKFRGVTLPTIKVPDKPTRGFEDALKQLFKRYGLKYRTDEFATMFFPNLN